MQWPYKFLILALFFVTQGNIYAEWTTGKGQFQSEKGDSEIFVKNQLLYAARKDIVTKELKRLAKNSAGTEDELIPYRQATKLAKMIGDPRVLTTIPGGTHNDLGDYYIYQEKLRELLD